MLRWVVCIAMANDNAVSDPQGARKLGRASYIVSSVGIVVSIVALGIAFGVIYGSSYNEDHMYNGVYYKHKTYAGSAVDCSDLYSGVYHNGYCYYNYK